VNPNSPLTMWLLLTALAGAVVVGLPLLLLVLKYRADSRQGQDRDVTALVSPLIQGFVKIHNDELYAHSIALARFVTVESFTTSIAGVRAEIRVEFEGLRSIMTANEARRREDMQTLREERKTDVELLRSDFERLRANLARAVGKRGNDANET
jgi:hypothetical protein